MAKIVEMRPKPKSEDLGNKIKAHTRYYDADGALVPGVTTIVRVLGFNTDVLVKWANKEGLAGNDSQKIKDETAAIGTLAHYLIECALKLEDPVLDDYSPSQVERARWALGAFYEWFAEHKLNARWAEAQLVSNVHGYGGTVDCYGELDDVPTLLDFKTSAGIYLEHKIQVAAYWKLLEGNGYSVEGVRILRIPRVPTEGFQEHIMTGVEVLACWKIFERALEIYRIHKSLSEV
jgi:hypothetical protein